MNSNATNEVRLDKWLWAARFYKTRGLAREMIQGGKVHYNHQRTKPGRSVEIGALISFRQGDEQKEVTIVALSDTRGPATIAQTLYQETVESQKKRQLQAEQRRLAPQPLPSDRRPDKKQRRQILRFKQNN
jgi:ribosome-associated heat shock protein Hsp15